MSPSNRPGGRSKRVVSGGGNATRRGSGLGTGGVGGGPRGSSSGGSSGGSFGSPSGGSPGGNRGFGGGGGGLLAVLLGLLVGGAGNNSGGSGGGTNKRGCLSRLLILGLIVIGAMLLFRMCSGGGSGGGLLDGLLGGYDTGDPGASLGTIDSGSSSSGGSGSALGGLLGSYGGTSGQIAPVSGSDKVYKPHEPDRTVNAAARAKYSDVSSADTVTVMVYLCGSDLETRGGMATMDLKEMIAASLNDNVRVIVESGGSSRWQNNEIKSGTNQRFRIVGQGRIQMLDANVGKRSMVEPATLADFIKYCKNNFPADRYMLILWDHGGGSLTGFGYDELFPGGSMDLGEINAALKSGGCKFDLIGFDACLMATLETALVAEQYADYLLASEAIEPGYGWHYTDWLTKLAADPSLPTLDVGKTIIDDFVRTSPSGSQTTLSLIDLAELKGTVPDAFSAFATSTGELIANNEYAEVASARSGSRDFSTSSRINQIDLIHFAENLGTPESGALARALAGCVKYNRNSTNVSHANGVSIYFPYQSMSKVSTALATYDAIGLDESYGDCIKSFASVAAGGQVASGSSANPLGTLLGDSGGSLLGTLLGGSFTGAETSGGSADTVTQLLDLFLSNRSVVTGDEDSSWVDESLVRASAADYRSANAGFAGLALTNKGGVAALVMSEEQWSAVVTLEQNVYVDDGEGYIDLGLDNIADYDEDGDLIMDYDGTWMSLNGQIVAYYLVSEDQVDEDYTILGRVPAMLNGARVNIILEFTNEHPYGVVLGAQYDYENLSDTIMKGLKDIAEGDEIDFLCDYYGYDGAYDDTYYLGERMIAAGEWEIGNAPLGDAAWQMCYRITDLYGGQYWTPTVKNY